MGQNNTVQIDLTVFSGEAKVTLEQTNNNEDWSVRQTYTAVTGPGYALLDARSIACSHVRVRWEEATGVNPTTVAGGINCSSQ
jgi:hypothetical protein